MIISDNMKQYMRNISEYPLLNPAEEVDLAAAIHGGDDYAVSRLVRANLRLVVAIALGLSSQTVSIEELVSEGNVGLIHAARKFDPKKGAKFSTYAAWWIRQAMRRALTEMDKVIRIPTSSLRKIRRIKRQRLMLTESLGREPSNEEIARNTELSEKVVGRLKGAEVETISLQQPIADGEAETIMNLVPDQSAPAPDLELVTRDLVGHLRRLLPRLSERERRILMLRFGLDGRPERTLEEISADLRLTRERVRQIQKRALYRMRLLLQSEDAIRMPMGEPSSN
jgi:RNA polymerase primary sigma factor